MHDLELSTFFHVIRIRSDMHKHVRTSIYNNGESVGLQLRVLRFAKPVPTAITGSNQEFRKNVALNRRGCYNVQNLHLR